MSQAGPTSASGGGGGAVNSVTGTANRATATPTTGNVVIDIAATYVGQTSITTLGTVATGVWQGTAVDATHGGTAQTSWTTGDMLYASGVNTLAKLTTVNNSVLLTNSSGVQNYPSPPSLVTGQLQWAHGSPLIGTASNRFYYYDDMISISSFQALGSNGGGTNTLDVDSDHPGCFYIQTGNSSSSGSAIIAYNSTNAHYLPNGKTYFETLVIVQDLATALQDYSYYAGMNDGFTTSAPSNGVYFEYTRATNTNWLIVTKNSGSTTSTDSGVAVSGNWVKLAWYYDPTGPLITFYINGTSVGTISTNIPTAQLIGINWLIRKSVGTNNARISMDYFEMFSLLTNVR